MTKVPDGWDIRYNVILQDLLSSDHFTVSEKSHELETSISRDEARFGDTDKDVLSRTLWYAPLEKINSYDTTVRTRFSNNFDGS